MGKMVKRFGGFNPRKPPGIKRFTKKLPFRVYVWKLQMLKKVGY